LRALWITTIMVLAGIALSSGSEPRNSVPVSMAQLIATPEKFDGKIVSVTGFFYLGREEALLYLHQEDYNHSLDANAIWFEPGEWVPKDVDRIQQTYVELVGTFSAAHRGPYGCPNGGLSVVDRFYLWSTPNNPTGLLHHTPRKSAE